jgi:hypothetical protein
VTQPAKRAPRYPRIGRGATLHEIGVSLEIETLATPAADAGNHNHEGDSTNGQVTRRDKEKGHEQGPVHARDHAGERGSKVRRRSELGRGERDALHGDGEVRPSARADAVAEALARLSAIVGRQPRQPALTIVFPEDDRRPARFADGNFDPYDA